MVLVSDIKEGYAINFEGRLFKVLEIVRHAGSGQMHGFIELKLKDVRFGHIADKRFKQTDKLETVNLIRRQMEYLYHDTENLVFMDPESFEQFSVSKSIIGEATKFVKEGAMATVELLGEEPIDVQFPKVAEFKVTMTGPGIRDGQDNTMKPAMLENGAEILVPEFVVTGDIVRVDTEKSKYVDRLMVKKM